MYLTYFNGSWSEGNAPLFGAMDHSVWLGSSVFDGARSVRGHMPDLRPHLERVVRSSTSVGLVCPLSVDEMEKLVREGVAKFPADAELYIRPLVFGTDGLLIPVAEKSAFALTLFDAPMPPFTGFSACLSSLRRPDADMAVADAKASALYANSTKALRLAKDKGYDNAVMVDSQGHVAEFATANLFFVTPEGKVVTPVPNGTFLSGITRSRTMTLLGDYGFKTTEKMLSVRDFLEADEIFSTGNHSKVVPITRIEDRNLQPGPVAKKARELYWEWAHSTPAG
jgi:branched-chain amino acid aminotransferase